MTVNKTSIYMWKRETTEGSAIITAAGDTAYQFGGYSEKIKEWDVQSVENTISQYYNQSSKSPALVYGNQEKPIFQTKCHPCSPIPEYQFLGIGNTAAGTGTVTLLDTTERKDSYTIRHEEREGTNQLIQKAGCFCVGISGKIELNMDELILQDWVWQTLEDNGDRAALTSEAQVIYPETIRTVYTGKPEVTWDVGVADIAFDEVYLVNWAQKQNITIVKTSTTHTVNMHEMEAVKLQLTAITKDNTQWDAMVDQETVDVNVKVYKQDSTSNNKTLKFKNVKIIKIHKHGMIENGYYLTTIECIAESFTCEFTDEFSTLTDWMPNTA